MTNVGGMDRVARLVLGAVLVAVALAAPSVAALAGLGGWRWGIGAVGLVLVLTAAFRFCPAYPLLGISTCRRE